MWLRSISARRAASTSAVTLAPTSQEALQHPAAMGDQARRRPLGILDEEASALVGEQAGVADLAAGLGVEGRAIQYHLNRLPRFGHRQRAIRPDQRQDRRRRLSIGVAEEVGRRQAAAAP